MQNQGAKKKPAASRRRAVFSIMPDVPVLETGCRFGRSVGVFVDEPEMPDELHRELRVFPANHPGKL